MKVIILGVRRLDETAEYEVRLKIGGMDHCAKLARDAKAPVWNPDSNFWNCMKPVSMAGKHVVKIVSDFSGGKDITFPLDLGEF